MRSSSTFDWGAIVSGILAFLAFLQTYLTKREVKAPKNGKARRLRKSTDEPTTLGERVESIAGDISSIKEQQADMSTAFINHTRDGHGGKLGGSK